MRTRSVPSEYVNLVDLMLTGRKTRLPFDDYTRVLLKTPEFLTSLLLTMLLTVTNREEHRGVRGACY